MVRQAKFEHVFGVPWSHATTAHWCKYPSPELPHVKDALVLSRHVDDKGRLHSVRLMCTQQALPALLKTFSNGLDSFYAIEKSMVDPENQVMVLKTRNLTFSSILCADETCVYRQHKDNPEETQFEWSVHCTCIKKVPFLTERVEQALVDKALGNSSSGIEKMVKLTQKVSDDWKAQGRPVIERWPTLRKFLSRIDQGNIDSIPDQPPWRRFYLFGPRKALSESKFFRNNGKDSS